MEIGIGLPSHIAHAPGLVDRSHGLAVPNSVDSPSVATIDRLVYESLDSVVALSVAAGATTDIGLVTNALLAPLHPAGLLAKQLASLAGAVGERLTLGLGVGSRPDDYAAVGVDYRRRGTVLHETVTLLRDACDAEGRRRRPRAVARHRCEPDPFGGRAGGDDPPRRDDR